MIHKFDWMEQLDIFGSEIQEYLFIIEPDQKQRINLSDLEHLQIVTTPPSEEILHSKPHKWSIELLYSHKEQQILSSVKSFDIELQVPEMWKNGTQLLY